MIEVGTKVFISVNEPWDSDKVINGTVSQSLKDGKYWVIQEDGTKDRFLVTCRHMGDKLSSIQNGRDVIVAIYETYPTINFDQIVEIDQKYLEYKFIGSMELAGK